jgi:hypothetical protein
MTPEFIKRVMCGMKGHWLVHVRNIHGDEINYRGGKRSVWRCANCGAMKLRDHLHYETKEPTNV